MRTIVAVALAFFVFAGAAPAADLGKYALWPDSPVAYFMTKAEREQWKSLPSEAAAADFVRDYLARRGPAFEADVAKRASMADQHLTIGKVKGSQTLSGKLIVLFGPPTDIKVSERQGKARVAAPPPAGYSSIGGASTGSGGGGSGRGGGTAGDASTVQQITPGQPGQLFRDYTFTFSGKNAPGLGRDQFVATVSVDMGTGKATLKDESKQDELDAAIEAVAAGSISKSAKPSETD